MAELQDEPDYWKGQAMRLAAELTDLAAALDAQHTWTEHELNRLMRELDEAKAEVARLHQAYRDEAQLRIEAKAELEEWRRDYDRGTKMSDLSAEVRSEINHWKGRAEKAEAEIARLQRENSDLNHNIVGMRSSNTNLVAELSEAKAEIARLRKAFEGYVKVTTPLLDSKALAAAITALKPDPYENSKPGEAWNKAYQPTEDALVKAKAEVDRLRSGITPNVSREYDTGENCDWPRCGCCADAACAEALPLMTDTGETPHRHTFTVPDGHVAVRDSEGRATGETVPAPEDKP